MKLNLTRLARHVSIDHVLLLVLLSSSLNFFPTAHDGYRLLQSAFSSALIWFGTTCFGGFRISATSTLAVANRDVTTAALLLVLSQICQSAGGIKHGFRSADVGFCRAHTPHQL